MYFEQGNLYHIYNQGNNRQQIFFKRENYTFFLEKIRLYVLPYADILAWCLMPNHFHLMVYVNNVCIITDGVTSSHPVSNSNIRSFNDSIGIMLRSYTRAINKQEDRTGALFREETKAICLNQNQKITPSWFYSEGLTEIIVDRPEIQYPNICFNYINFNPLKDGLVKKNEDWEFSSYPDIVGLHKGTLINWYRIEEFGLHIL